MLRQILAHVYVIVMAIFVVMTGTILANHYGADIINSLGGVADKASQEMTDIQRGVQQWNRNVLD